MEGRDSCLYRKYKENVQNRLEILYRNPYRHYRRMGRDVSMCWYITESGGKSHV